MQANLLRSTVDAAAAPAGRGGPDFPIARKIFVP
jgi:hypothetical protein